MVFSSLSSILSDFVDFVWTSISFFIHTSSLFSNLYCIVTNILLLLFFLCWFLFVWFCSANKANNKVNINYSLSCKNPKSDWSVKINPLDAFLCNKIIIYLHILAPHRYSHMIFIFITINFKRVSVSTRARASCVSLQAILHLLLEFLV